jgi:hypothetical protein
MDFLLLELANRESQDLDTYVGIIHALNSPFHLYINLSDLNNTDNIKVLIYSIGEKKEIIWGRYYLKTGKINFESSCKYTLALLNAFLKTWTALGYEYIANSVHNKITQIFKLFNDEPILNVSEYKVLKYAFAYLEGRIDKDEFIAYDNDNLLPGIIYKLGIEDVRSDFIDFDILQTQITEIAESIKEIDATINLTTIDQDILTQITSNKELLLHIVAQFYDTIQEGPYNNNSFYSTLQKCESSEFCSSSDSPICDIYDFLDQNSVDFR